MRVSSRRTRRCSSPGSGIGAVSSPAGTAASAGPGVGARSSSTETSGRSRPVAKEARLSSSLPSSSAWVWSATTPNRTSGLARNRSATTVAPSSRAGRTTRSTRSARAAASASALARAPERPVADTPGSARSCAGPARTTRSPRSCSARTSRCDCSAVSSGVAPSTAISIPEPPRRTPRRRAASRSGSRGSVRRSSICRYASIPTAAAITPPASITTRVPSMRYG